LPPPPPPPPLASSSNPPLSASAAELQKEPYNPASIPIETTIPGEAATASKKEKPHKAKKSSSKKLKKVKDFVLPDHLVPNEGDTDAERNKKRRAAKALKNKWRLQKKEIESNNRQKSWQSFQRKSSSSSGSIFATKEGLDDRVGVVSKKQLTEFGARKRHK
jgi:survival-of-motor-neuron-related-splicing factor 30